MTASPVLPPDVARRLSARVGSDAGVRILMLDVDGTLAPVVSRPEQAIVPTDTLEALQHLAREPLTRVVVVSGRRVGDVRRLVPVDGVWAIGNHGIETMPPSGAARVEPHAAAYQPTIAEASRRIAMAIGGVAGLVIEDKTWTISVHYRLVDRQLLPLIRQTVEAQVATSGLVMTAGKEVLEIRPPVAIDKGTAAVSLAAMLAAEAGSAAPAILYVGDDRTDEDAFRALRVAWPETVTVLVTSDVPAEPLARATGDTAAEFVVRDPAGVRQLLGDLLRS